MGAQAVLVKVSFTKKYWTTHIGVASRQCSGDQKLARVEMGHRHCP